MQFLPENKILKITRFAWWTLYCNLAVMLWGAYVRAASSGAGCGNKWPECAANALATSARAQMIVEFTHPSDKQCCLAHGD